MATSAPLLLLGFLSAFSQLTEGMVCSQCSHDWDCWPVLEFCTSVKNANEANPDPKFACMKEALFLIGQDGEGRQNTCQFNTLPLLAIYVVAALMLTCFCCCCCKCCLCCCRRKRTPPKGALILIINPHEETLFFQLLDLQDETLFSCELEQTIKSNSLSPPQVKMTVIIVLS